MEARVGGHRLLEAVSRKNLDCGLYTEIEKRGKERREGDMKGGKEGEKEEEGGREGGRGVERVRERETL